MEPGVFAAVLAAAAMHAGWNALLKLRLDPFLAMTLLTASAGIVALPALFVTGLADRAALPWLAASVTLHLAYYVTLSAAYARADMSQIYPIARGGAPLLTALVSVTVLGEPVSGLQLVGIGALGGAVGAMSVFGRRGAPFDPVAVGLALLTAVVICGYTLSDGLGARAAGDPHAYSATLFVLDAPLLLAFALWRRGPAALAPALRFRWQGLGGGAMSVASYWIAIWAMTRAPIPLVAALRESSVLFAVVIAVLVVKEPLQWSRAIAAGVILLALALVRLG